MSVYKKAKSPYWHFDFWVKGNRFHGSTGTTSKRDAEVVERRERQAAVFAQPDAARMTLDIALRSLHARARAAQKIQ
jgi:hypothetical protein